MRILFFSSIFPRSYAPNRGVYCHHLCKAVAELPGAGHRVKVVSPRSWLDVVSRKRPQGTPCEGGYLNVRGLEVDYPTYFYPPGVWRGSYGWFMQSSVGQRLGRRLGEFAPDCVVSYWTHPDGEVATRAAHAAGVPSVVTVGGSDVLLIARRPRRRGQIVRALAAADAVVTVSRDMRDKVIDLGVAPERAHVVYRGVDGELFSPSDRGAARLRLGVPADARVLLFVGNLVPLKGVDVLLRALRRLLNQGPAGHPPLLLYLVGHGPARKALEAQVAAEGLSDAVRFAGAVVQDALPDWYRSADLTVLPSRSEGVPNVLRESLACGTPFVATRVGGIHEISDSTANRLVPPDDADALADAIAASLAAGRPDTAIATRAGTWADSARELVKVIESLPRTSGQSAALPAPFTDARTRPGAACGILPASEPVVARQARCG